MDEFSLIAKIFTPLAQDAAGAYGLSDDAALVEVPAGRRLVVTNDMIVSGVHFLADDPPALVGRKLLRVNLSDLAAMGAIPRAYLLAIALPRSTGEHWLKEFAKGLGEDQATFDVSLIGGDTVATDGPLTASLTALGEVDKGREVLRRGAKPGDLIYVSGVLGDAALGLMSLRSELEDVDAIGHAALADRYRLPQPRVALGVRLSKFANAAIDVSDGLVADLGHICDCSGVGAEIDSTLLPLSNAARGAIATRPSLISAALTGGDDYEIAFTCEAASTAQVKAVADEIGLPITRIGQIIEGRGITVVDEDGKIIDVKTTGYQHF